MSLQRSAAVLSDGSGLLALLFVILAGLVAACQFDPTALEGPTGPVRRDVGGEQGDSGAGDDVEEVRCVVGEVRCEGDILMECVGYGDWQLTRCNSAESCFDGVFGCRCIVEGGGCIPRTCYPGTFGCAGSSVVQCNDEGSEFLIGEDCAETDGAACIGGLCQSIQCEPNTNLCIGAGIFWCDNAGQVQPVEDCFDTESYCTVGDAGPECTPWTCRPWTTICAAGGESIAQCSPNGDTFEEPVPCPFGERCFGGVCSEKECEPGSPPGCEGRNATFCDDNGTRLGLVICGAESYCEQGLGCVAQVCH